MNDQSPNDHWERRRIEMERRRAMKREEEREKKRELAREIRRYGNSLISVGAMGFVLGTALLVIALISRFPSTTNSLLVSFGAVVTLTIVFFTFTRRRRVSMLLSDRGE
ncbi:hypothetical protein [Haloferax profundi]|uniref:hypothetical protein n=1 Tax=Haloferax profundi TaxID=1544718 RepID=UPI0012F70BE4|nr:hypothetical protein [Haloferax profundi]